MGDAGRVKTARRAALIGWLLTGAGCGDTPSLLTTAQLRDPEACRSCHPAHYDEWAGSMHAYASDDPVFAAKNARVQRETAGAQGTCCVN